MKKFTKLASFFLLAATLAFVGCDKGSDTDGSQPSLTAPSDASVTVNDTTSVAFGVTVTGGYQSATIQSAQKGNASITSQPEAGAQNGELVVQYIANSSGAGSVTLQVTDQNNNTVNATAVITVNQEQNEVRVTDNITSDQTWEDGKTYILAGRIAVEAGATLTIEPGVIVKGEAGTGSNATALLVARDANIEANGTAQQPIIFTSVADEITPEMVDNGNFGSPNLTSDQRGLWGGVLVLGNAPISASSDPASIEGIPSTDENGLYGGNSPDDDSGTLNYVTIRHGGANIGSGNEINGLSLGGVGTGTTIKNIEIVANQDDGVEWFGGTVNVTNVLVWNNGDDAIDADQAWTGTVDNVVTVSPGGSTMELDGPEGSYTSSGYTITNVSAYVETNGSELIDVDPETDADIKNTLFFGLATNDDGSAANAFSSDYPDYADNQNGYAVTSIEAVLPSNTALADYFPGSLVSNGEVVSVSSVSDATVGANASVFSWTWASQSGALSKIGLE